MSQTQRFCDDISRLYNDKNIQSNDILEISLSLSSVEESDNIPIVYKKQLLQLIKDILKSTNKDLQKSTLTLLCQCFDVNIFKKEVPIQELFFVIIDDILCKNIEVIDDQELWIKAFEALLLIADNISLTSATDEIDKLLNAINAALKSSVISSPLKYKALKLLKNIVIKSECNETISKNLLNIFHDVLIKTLFDLNNKHLKLTVDVLYHINDKISHKIQMQHPNWETYVKKDITTNYLNVITDMVNNENINFCDIWIFIVKNLRTELQKNWFLCNNLLTSVEKAFKSHNMEIRRLAYLCWQNLIENFALSLNEMMLPKRIKLLLIPLRTNNCKTEELIKIKHVTWCTLFNVLNTRSTRLSITDLPVLENYLSFCFGQFGDTPFLSYTHQNNLNQSPGKKCPAIHLEMCYVFLKLIANSDIQKRIPKLDVKKVEFNEPFVTSQNFIMLSTNNTKMDRVVVYSVGEASILLCQLNNEDDAVIAEKINVLLWESLLELIESTYKTNDIYPIIKDLSDTVLDLFGLSRKRSKLSKFTITPLFNLLTSNKYEFCKLDVVNEKLFSKLVLRIFKKDNTAYEELISIFDNLLMFKENNNDLFNYVNCMLKDMSVIMNDSCIQTDKSNNLFEVWKLIGSKLKNVKDVTINFDDEENDSFKNYLQWAIDYSHLAFNENDVIELWKSVFDAYVKVSSLKSAEKLSQFLIEYNDKNSPLPFATISRFLCLIMYQIKFKDLKTDVSVHIVRILENYNKFLSKSDLPNNIIDELFKCLCFIFENCCFEESLLLNIIPILTDSLSYFKNKKQELILLNSLKTFFNSVPSTPNLKPLIEKLLSSVKTKCNDPETLSVFNSLSSLLKAKFSDVNNDSFTDLISDLKVLINDEKKDDSKKKRSSIISSKNKNNEVPNVIDGVNIDTMKPVKLKGSMLAKQTETVQNIPSTSIVPSKVEDAKESEELVFINSPYKFDPKKLTKSQKAKLGRRRDDIPALYQDLSQSQTQDFSSNSEPILETQSENNLNAEKMETDERPFGQICQNNNSEKLDENSPYEDNITNSPQSEIKRKKKVELELAKIKMNIVGYEDMNIDTNTAMTTRKKSLNIKLDKPEYSERKKQKRNRKSKSLVSDDINASQESNEQKTDLDTEVPSECIIENSQEENSKDSTKSIKKNKSFKNTSQTELNDSKETINKNRSKTVKSPETIDENILPKKLDHPNENLKPKEKDTNSIKKSRQIVPKIVLSRSPNCKGSQEEFMLKKIVKEPKVSNNENEENSEDTEPVNSQVLEIISDNIAPMEYPNANINICRKVLFDKNSSESEELTEQPESPKRKINSNKIVTSPVRNDTPIRNKEFIKNTSEISPIKSNNQELLNQMEIVANTKADGDKSPELFNSDHVSDGPKEVIESCNSTPVITSKATRKNALFPQGRGAQMMNMISQKTPNKIEPTPVTGPISKNDEEKTEEKTPVFRRTGSSRISKMIARIEKESNDTTPQKTITDDTQISEEDVLHFTKNVPSPTATPRCSILRKRKQPDNVEDGLSPCAKRKRVNFCDPPVSCRKFIESRQSKVKARLKPKILSMFENETTVISNEEMCMDVEQTSTETDISQPSTSHAHPNEIEQMEANIEEICDLYKKDKVKKIFDSTSGEFEIVSMTLSDTDMFTINNEKPVNSHEENNKASSEYEIESNNSSKSSRMHITESTFSSANVSMDNGTVISNIPKTNDHLKILRNITESFNSDENDLDSNEESDVLVDTYSNECYKKFLLCIDPIYSNLKKLKTINCDPDKFILILELSNIKTIGDLAKLTSKDIKALSVDVGVVKTILDTHNCDMHLLKYAPNKTNKVSVIASSSDSMKMMKELFDEKNFEKCMNSIDAKFMNRLDTSPSSSSSSSDACSPSASPCKNEPPYKWTSPILISPKENMLNIRISGGKLSDILLDIKNIFIEKKWDQRYLQKYFGSLDTSCSPTISTPVRIHHVAKHQKWDDIFSDIVAHIGIKKVIKHLTKLKSVPQDVLLKYISLYISKNTSVLTIKNMLSIFDPKLVFEALLQLINHDDLPEIHFKFLQEFQDYFMISIIENPNIFSCLLDKLSVVQIQDIVVEKIGNDNNKNEFTQTLFNRLYQNDTTSLLPLNIFDIKQEKTDASKKHYLKEALMKAIDDDFVPDEETFELLKKFFNRNVKISNVYHSTVDMFSSVFHNSRPQQ